MEAIRIERHYEQKNKIVINWPLFKSFFQQKTELRFNSGPILIIIVKKDDNWYLKPILILRESEQNCIKI